MKIRLKPKNNQYGIYWDFLVLDTDNFESIDIFDDNEEKLLHAIPIEEFVDLAKFYVQLYSNGDYKK